MAAVKSQKELSLSFAIETKLILELRHIEINDVFYVQVYHLFSKNQSDNSSVDLRDSLFGHPFFISHNATAWSALLQKVELCKAKPLSNITFLLGLLSDETETPEGKIASKNWNMPTSHENQEYPCWTGKLRKQS